MTEAFFMQIIITTLSYAILTISFLGIGMYSSKIFRIDFPFEYKFFSLIWLGWCITLIFLQVVNLILPINAYISISILIFGLIAVTVQFKISFWIKLIHQVPKVYIAFGVAAIIWVASASMLQPSAYDSGLYHFNSIRWLNEFPLVLGLGNLHGRLAFNQSLFSFVAFLNVYPFFNFGHNLANSFLLLTLLLECLFYLSKFITSLCRGTNIKIIDAITIFFIPHLIFLEKLGYPTISSPTADITSSIVQILIFIYFLRSVDIKTLDLSKDSQTKFVLIMSATAITIKLNNLFFVLSICFLLLMYKFRSLKIPTKLIPLISTKLIMLPAIIMFVWILRGFLLSGCPAYPSTIGCIDTSWSVPIASVKSEADWIYSWARFPRQTPDKVLNSWEWLNPWFYRVIWNNKTNILLAVYPLLVFIGIGLSIGIYHSILSTHRVRKIWFIITLPVLIGLLFWFFIAPDLRFAGSLFLILPISASVILLKALETQEKLRIAITIIIFFIININVGGIVIQNPQHLIRISGTGNMPITVAKLTEKTTISGLKILVPTKGDQCWDSKVPCTPYFENNLNFNDTVMFPEFTLANSSNK